MVFRFEDITAFSEALAQAHGSLALPRGETVADGEWILATFEIGSRTRATAAAARGVRAAGDTHIAFERRDWDRLTAFVVARSEHMRAARPFVPVEPSGESSSVASVHVHVPAPSQESPPPESTLLEPSRVPFTARLLLIDDDPESREVVRGMLNETGLDVETVDDAEQALARMVEVAFDALVLDFHSRRLDPLVFVRQLRRDPVRALVPVLILSHRASSRDAVDAFASGADDFLHRPFRAPELGARIFGMLRRARLTRHGSVLPGPLPPSASPDGSDRS